MGEDQTTHQIDQLKGNRWVVAEEKRGRRDQGKNMFGSCAKPGHRARTVGEPWAQLEGGPKKAERSSVVGQRPEEGPKRTESEVLKKRKVIRFKKK